MAYPQQQYYPQYYQQPMMAQPQPQPIQAQPQQMQNAGFMSVRSEQDARNYPVAPGNVMTFKIEGQPYVCEKAQGFSQLEGPIFNKYRLVKEESMQTQEDVSNLKSNNSPTEDDIKALWSEIEVLKKEISKLTPQRKKKEVVEDDE